VVIPFQFDRTEDFIKGKALVSKNGHRFKINIQGICIEDCPK